MQSIEIVLQGYDETYIYSYKMEDHEDIESIKKMWEEKYTNLIKCSIYFVDKIW